MGDIDEVEWLCDVNWAQSPQFMAAVQRLRQTQQELDRGYRLEERVRAIPPDAQDRDQRVGHLMTIQFGSLLMATLEHRDCLKAYRVRRHFRLPDKRYHYYHYYGVRMQDAARFVLATVSASKISKPHHFVAGGFQVLFHYVSRSVHGVILEWAFQARPSSGVHRSVMHHICDNLVVNLRASRYRLRTVSEGYQ